MVNRYDRVDFYAWDSDSKSMERVCQAFLVDGKIVYEGKYADEVRKGVEEDPHLKKFEAAGAYAVLARMQVAYQGSYFHATPVLEATAL